MRQSWFPLLLSLLVTTSLASAATIEVRPGSSLAAAVRQLQSGDTLSASRGTAA